jgi:hypothetical protein
MNEKAKQQAELPNDGSLVLRAGADGACITVTAVKAKWCRWLTTWAVVLAGNLR